MSISSTAVRVLAHRGASGVALENSIAAFLKARELGADGVELDIHATRDGELVVHHDPDLPSLGPIRDLAAAGLAGARLPNGEPIPTLSGALEVLGGLEVWIEVKALPADSDAALLARIDQAPSPELCGIHSFDHRIIARLHRARPGLRLGVLSASYPLDLTGPMLAAGARVLWQEARLIDAELVDTVHRRGGQVIAWTVNDQALARGLRQLGVDALCGNYPERLRFN